MERQCKVVNEKGAVHRTTDSLCGVYGTFCNDVCCHRTGPRTARHGLWAEAEPYGQETKCLRLLQQLDSVISSGVECLAGARAR